MGEMLSEQHSASLQMGEEKRGEVMRERGCREAERTNSCAACTMSLTILSAADMSGIAFRLSAALFSSDRICSLRCSSNPFFVPLLRKCPVTTPI